MASGQQRNWDGEAGKEGATKGKAIRRARDKLSSLSLHPELALTLPFASLPVLNSLSCPLNSYQGSEDEPRAAETVGLEGGPCLTWPRRIVSLLPILSVCRLHTLSPHQRSPDRHMGQDRALQWGNPALDGEGITKGTVQNTALRGEASVHYASTKRTWET